MKKFQGSNFIFEIIIKTQLGFLKNRLTGLYLRIITITCPLSFFVEVIKRGLITASIVFPQLIVNGFLNVIMTTALNFLFITVLKLGFVGAAVAFAVNWLFQLPAMILAAKFSGISRKIWGGWTKRALHGWKPFLKLSAPGFVMICAEWSSFEVMAILAGLGGPITLAAYSILYQSFCLCFIIPTTLSEVASARVGSNLGAGKRKLARFTAAFMIGKDFCCFEVKKNSLLRTELHFLFICDYIVFTSEKRS
jgi:MATE family multidrug resistance protein